MKYILRNVGKTDANLGDLRIKIPVGKAINLLGVKSSITLVDIEKSEKSGSIGARLGKTLIKVYGVNDPKPPPKEISKSSLCVVFPQRQKSSIIINIGEVEDNLKDLVIEEEEEDYLKQLEEENRVGDEELEILKS